MASFLNVDLQPLAGLRQVRETGLAHAAQGLHASGDADGAPRTSSSAVFAPYSAQDGGNRVAELEALAIGRKPSASIFANPRHRRCCNSSSSRDKSFS